MGRRCHRGGPRRDSAEADAKGEQSATAYGIGATTAGGKQLIIMLVSAGKDLTALQFLLEE